MTSLSGEYLSSADVGFDDIEDQGGGGMSVSAWVHPKGVGEYGGNIIGKNTNPPIGEGRWVLTHRHSGDEYTRLIFSKGYESSVLTAEASSPELQMNTWYHVTATWDGSADASNVRLYVNGTYVANTVETDGVGAKLSDASEDLTLSSPSRELDAYLDDVRVYDRVLSASEIQQLYQMGEGTKFAQTVSPSTGLESGLVGHWTFDGPDVDWSSSTAEIRDTSGQGNHGDAINGMSVDSSPMPGVIGQGMSFDDDSATYKCITVPDDMSIQDLSQFSTSVWIKKIGDSWEPTITSGLITKTHNNTQGWVFWFGGDWTGVINRIELRIDYDGTSDVRRVTTDLEGLDDGHWHHLAATWGGSASGTDIHLYHNGIEVSYSDVEDGDGSYKSDATRTLNFGSRSASCSQNTFSEAMDDVRLYNRALSAEEVMRLYQLGR